MKTEGVVYAAKEKAANVGARLRAEGTANEKPRNPRSKTFKCTCSSTVLIVNEY